uniref:Uncharacterized protein n=1 Tax=Candidatus Methanomethylicus mesodigestus TaxID=1867258 RepID=A0A7C3EWB9_9CREN
MKVMVVDATHGGITLSEEFRVRGDEVTCVDIHRTMSKEELERCSKHFSVERDLPDPSRYDLIVKPVHFPSEPFRGVEDRLITHHQAVRTLACGLIRFPVVEITGSFGKTTSVLCAISLLKERFSILGLTSKGICFHSERGSEILEDNISATPANIIKALRLVPEAPDLAIFEVSLGGTGLADLGIIKNVYDDYPIAKGTSCASKAKVSMMTDRKNGSTVLVNADDSKLSRLVGVQHFSPSGIRSEVRAEDVRLRPDGIEFTVSFEGFRSLVGPISGTRRVKSTRGPVGRQHVENMLVGVAIASYITWNGSDIEFSAEPFEKKMVLESLDPPRVINRSPSVSTKSIEASIRDYLELYLPVKLEVGGKLKTTCGAVEPKEVANVIRTSPFKEVALFGEFGNSLAQFLEGGRFTKTSAVGAVPSLILERT